MTILSDVSIRAAIEAGDLEIDPPPVDAAYQPCSLDLALGDSLLVWPSGVTRDPRFDQRREWEAVELFRRPDSDLTGWHLLPGRRYLATTREHVALPAHLAGRLEGRSSWARDGLCVHHTAGWLDAGYRGRPTVELSVVGSWLVIWPGADCLQLVVQHLDQPAARPYGHADLGSRYLADADPTPARVRGVPALRAVSRRPS